MSGRERQVLYDVTCMWNLNNDINELTKQEWTHRYRKSVCGYQSGWQKDDGEGELGGWNEHIHTFMFKINKDLL